MFGWLKQTTFQQGLFLNHLTCALLQDFSFFSLLLTLYKDHCSLYLIYKQWDYTCCETSRLSKTPLHYEYIRFVCASCVRGWRGVKCTLLWNVTYIKYMLDTEVSVEIEKVCREMKISCGSPGFYFILSLTSSPFCCFFPPPLFSFMLPMMLYWRPHAVSRRTVLMPHVRRAWTLARFWNWWNLTVNECSLSCLFLLLLGRCVSVLQLPAHKHSPCVALIKHKWLRVNIYKLQMSFTS